MAKDVARFGDASNPDQQVDPPNQLVGIPGAHDLVDFALVLDQPVDLGGVDDLLEAIHNFYADPMLKVRY